MARAKRHQHANIEATRKTKAGLPQYIRHKARQKAIHHARHGNKSRYGQRSGDGAQSYLQDNAQRQATIHVGSRFDPIELSDTEGPGREVVELETCRRMGSDPSYDMSSSTTEEKPVIVHMKSSLEFKGSAEDRPAKIMFPMPEALAIYKEMCDAGFPLMPARRERFLPHGDNASQPQPSSLQAPLQKISLSSMVNASNAHTQTSHSGRNYIFDFGKYTGRPFSDVPEHYLRIIGDQSSSLDSKHLGLKEAFEYHRPGLWRHVPVRQRPQPSQPHPSASKTPKIARKDTFNQVQKQFTMERETIAGRGTYR